jgi:hypothetical protein
MKTDTKQPIIRPGQCKPYAKATRQQIDERIGYVARLLRDGRSKFQIHRAVRWRFNIEWRQCDRYISWLTRPRTLASLKTVTKQDGSHDSRARARLDCNNSAQKCRSPGENGRTKS